MNALFKSLWHMSLSHALLTIYYPRIVSVCTTQTSEACCFKQERAFLPHKQQLSDGLRLQSTFRKLTFKSCSEVSNPCVSSRIQVVDTPISSTKPWCAEKHDYQQSTNHKSSWGCCHSQTYHPWLSERRHRKGLKGNVCHCTLNFPCCRSGETSSSHVCRCLLIFLWYLHLPAFHQSLENMWRMRTRKRQIEIDVLFVYIQSERKRPVRFNPHIQI